jgi:predicted acetyltransferase
MHDMAEWFEIDTDDDGSYSYDTASIWKNGYDAYLAKTGGAIAGFALIGTAAEWLGGIAAHDVHEFFIIRRYRGCGLGRRMAAALWDERPGEWLVRVLEANTPAVLFWRAATAAYSSGLFEEEQRIVQGRQWRFLRFKAGSSE